MAMRQDSTHPTGVAAPTRKHGEPGNDTAVRARDRKANAAIQMRLAGATWDEVAEALGYPTPRQALVATEKALEKQLQDSGDREQMRRMAGARLDRMLRAVWTKAIDPQSPEQMAAQREARATIAQHAKLFGLDAPTEHVIHSPTRDELERWVSHVTSTQVPDVQEVDIFEIDFVEEEESHALPPGT
jgi:hypothetical protein